jgi:hypothetical protein
MIVPGGGLSFDGTRWVSSRSDFLEHVKVLARLFRGKMLVMLMEAHGAGQLTFFNSHAGLADKRTFKRFIGPLRHSKWVVYCKAPFAGPKQVLRYLSRYTNRVAISNRRLITARDFVPWCFLDAGRLSARDISSHRRPKTCTGRTLTGRNQPAPTARRTSVPRSKDLRHSVSSTNT